MRAIFVLLEFCSGREPVRPYSSHEKEQDSTHNTLGEGLQNYYRSDAHRMLVSIA